jgi:pimeloyl-ACP methyl ester carboxylesterase
VRAFDLGDLACHEPYIHVQFRITMNKAADFDPATFITSLNMNGLRGRMLSVPMPKRRGREILFIYGHHSSIERWAGVIQELNRYGSVTVPDLPGFGGMESLYKIGQKPTLDALADYLAAFVKLRYKNRRFTIVGLSFGFLVVTRMLQRYPELAKKVDLVVSVVGFAHRDDFKFSRSRYWFYRAITQFLSLRIPAWAFGVVFAHRPFVIRRIYNHSTLAKDKFRDIDGDAFMKNMEMEVMLWRANEVRTHMATNVAQLSVDNCKQSVNVPLWHVSTMADVYFNEHIVEQHLQVIFHDFHQVKSSLDAHAPTVIATAQEAAKVIPPKLRRVLAKS